MLRRCAPRDNGTPDGVKDLLIGVAGNQSVYSRMQKNLAEPVQLSGPWAEWLTRFEDAAATVQAQLVTLSPQSSRSGRDSKTRAALLYLVYFHHGGAARNKMIRAMIREMIGRT